MSISLQFHKNCILLHSLNLILTFFNNFIDKFSKQYNKIVELRANEILKEKYDRLIEPLMEIQEELEYQRDTIRKYNNN